MANITAIFKKNYKQMAARRLEQSKNIYIFFFKIFFCKNKFKEKTLFIGQLVEKKLDCFEHLKERAEENEFDTDN